MEYMVSSRIHLHFYLHYWDSKQLSETDLDYTPNQPTSIIFKQLNAPDSREFRYRKMLQDFGSVVRKNF